MKVYVTGGTGFVGRAVVRELLARGVTPRLLVRPGSEAKLGDDASRVEATAGDLLDAEAHAKAAEGCDAAIHLVGIIRELPLKGVTFQKVHVKAVEALLEGLKDASVPRLVHVSALGARADSKARYQSTKWQGERLVRYSGLAWTLLRPGVILGADGEFFRMVRGSARGPLAPLPGRGGFQFQPVAVEHVARAAVDAALEKGDRFEGKTYEAGGEERVDYRGLVESVARAMKKSPPMFLPVPIPLLKLAAALMDWLPLFPVTRDQLTMMEEGSVVQDGKPFFDGFGVTPVPLERLIDHCVNGTPLGPEAERQAP